MDAVPTNTPVATKNDDDVETIGGSKIRRFPPLTSARVQEEPQTPWLVPSGTYQSGMFPELDELRRQHDLVDSERKK